MAIKTPSKSKQETLDNIQMIVGKISESEELTQESVEDIDEKLGKKGLEDLVIGIDILIDKMTLASNMLVAIAGYLFGDKGINTSSNYASLTSKIKNTAPIFGDSPIVIPDLDTLSKPADEAFIYFDVTGIDGKGIDALTEMIKELNSNFATTGSESIEAITSSLEILNNVVSVINELDLKSINKNQLNKVVLLSQICETISTAPGFNATPNSKAINDFVVICPDLNKAIDTITSLDFKNIKSKEADVDSLNDIIDKLASLKLNKFNKTYLTNIENLGIALKNIFDIPLFKDKVDSKTSKNMKGVDELFDQLKVVIDKVAALDFSKYNKKFLEKISIFADFIYNLMYSCDVLQQLLESDEDFIEVSIFTVNLQKNAIDKLIELDFTGFNKTKIKQLENFNKYIAQLVHSANILSKSVMFIKLAQTFKEDILGYTKMLSEFISGNNGKGGLVMVMARIEKATANGLDLKIVNKFFTELRDVMKTINKLSLQAKLASILKGTLIKSIGVLNEIIDEVNDINIKKITANISGLHDLAEFITDLRTIFVGVTVCAIFALPAFVGAYLIKFTAEAIINTLNIAIQGINKIIAEKQNVDNIKEFAKIVLVLGGIMLIAALVGGILIKNAANVLGFAALLAAFIGLVVFAISLATIFANAENLYAVGQLSHIIVTCSLVMMFGALFMLTGLAPQALMFGLTLAAFIFIVMIPFTIMSRFFKNAIAGAKEISILIVTCTLVMMLGALFMLTGLWKESLLFGATLMTFILMVIAPFILLIKMGGRKAIKAVDDIKNLIITCTIILIMGAFLMMIPDFRTNALLFAALVAGFVILIVGTFALLSKKISQAKGALFAVMAIILVSSLMVMIGAGIIEKYGWENPLIFAAIVVGMITILGGAAALLSLMGAQIFIGVGAMFALSIIIVIAASSLNTLGDAFQKFGNWKQALAMSGILVGVVLAFGGLAIALGAMTLIPFFWAGIGATAAIVGIIVLVSVAFKNIGEAMATLASLEGKEIDGESLTAMVDSFIGIAKKLQKINDEIDPWVINAVAKSMTAVAIMMSKLGIAVQDISNLKCAVSWDKDGNPTEYRQLEYSDFDNAAKNTEVIITTLGNAIIDTYNKNPKMFEEPSAGGIAGFFGKKGKSPFDIVVRSCTGMGNMISTIGKAVADVSNLKVATKWDSEGNPIAFEQLNYDDFKSAAENTKEIITTLGGAIIETYNKNMHLFEVPPVEVSFLGFKIKKQGKGKTPFEKTVIACTAMGGMISSIANGVKDMADLKIATKWDKEGNPTAYRRLKQYDFIEAAKSINEIITVVGKKIGEIYKEDKIGIFQQGLTFKDGKLEGGDTPIMRVLTAANSMGTAMSNIAGGVKDLADLRIEEYDNYGNKTGRFKKLLPADFTEASTNVGLVTTTLAKAIEKVYNDTPWLFDEVVTYTTYKTGFLGLSRRTDKHESEAPIVKVLSSAENLGIFISDCATAVKEMIDLKFTNSEGKTIKIDPDKDLGENGTVKKNIAAVVTCLGKSLVNIYDAGANTYFNPDYEGYWKIENSFNKSKSIISNSLETITEISSTLENVKKQQDLVTKWEYLITGIYRPINNGTLTLEKSKTLQNTFANLKGEIKEVVTTINSIDEEKTDKFIQLANELSQLSFNLGDMSKFVEALDGKINSTLALLAAKLEVAANAIKESENAQNKRQLLIDKNTKKIESVMKMPMTVTLTKENSLGRSTSSISGSGGGSVSMSTSTVNNTPSSDASYNSYDDTTLNSLVSAVNAIKNKICG